MAGIREVKVIGPKYKAGSGSEVAKPSIQCLNEYLRSTDDNVIDVKVNDNPDDSRHYTYTVLIGEKRD